MIKILDNSRCCGCGACAQICPKHCISMLEDKEGFLYPQVDYSLCVNCALCELICPEKKMLEEREPIKIFAVKNRNENIRLNSSSGGAFTELAESVIKEGGVVFGARFDENWEVIHDYVDSIEELHLFRGSKYVQSRIGNTFIDVRRFLESGRKVLFSGTSCQIKALLCFLRKDYSNLITIDVICHGVPSPKVWLAYKKQISHLKNIKSIKFRDKVTGWKHYSSFLYYVSKYSGERSIPLSEYMTLFFSNMILRPSCYKCLFKGGRCGSDVTLGDFWGVEKVMSEFDDDKGISLVLVYKEEIIKQIEEKFDVRIIKYEDVIPLNQCIVSSSVPHLNRNFFFYRFARTNNVQKAFHQLYSKNLLMRIYRTFYRKLYK